MDRNICAIDKKWILLLVSFLSVLILSGCVASSDFTEGTAEITESTQEQHFFPDYVYDQEKAQSLADTYYAVSEEGYYYIANSILYFYDISDGNAFPLCTKASCMHTDQKCNAYIYDYTDERPDWVTNSLYEKIYYYNAHLYMISQKWDGNSFLYQYDKDFTNQKEIGQIAWGTETPRVLFQDIRSSVIHNGFLYYLTFEMAEDWLHSELRDVPYTLRRIRLEEKSEPEELYTFEFPIDYNLSTASYVGFRILTSGDDVYCIGAIQSREFETKDRVQQRVIRYRESEGAELLWTYAGDEKVNLFGCAGEGPFWAYFSALNMKGELTFLTEAGNEAMSPKSLTTVNLLTKESRLLYRTPYDSISRFFTDGNNYYFTEYEPGHRYLTAIDQEGNLIRRYEFEYTDSYMESMEKQGIPREQWGGAAGVLLLDSRYIAVGCGEYGGVYKGLTHKGEYDYSESAEIRDTDAIGLILTEDFLDGKDVEIQQIN